MVSGTPSPSLSSPVAIILSFGLIVPPLSGLTLPPEGSVTGVPSSPFWPPVVTLPPSPTSTLPSSLGVTVVLPGVVTPSPSVLFSGAVMVVPGLPSPPPTVTEAPSLISMLPSGVTVPPLSSTVTGGFLLSPPSPPTCTVVPWPETSVLPSGLGFTLPPFSPAVIVLSGFCGVEPSPPVMVAVPPPGRSTPPSLSRLPPCSPITILSPP